VGELVLELARPRPSSHVNGRVLSISRLTFSLLIDDEYLGGGSSRGIRNIDIFFNSILYTR
jgi:hypothetical protein